MNHGWVGCLRWLPRVNLGTLGLPSITASVPVQWVSYDPDRGVLKKSIVWMGRRTRKFAKTVWHYASWKFLRNKDCLLSTTEGSTDALCFLDSMPPESTHPSVAHRPIVGHSLGQEAIFCLKVYLQLCEPSHKTKARYLYKSCKNKN